MSQTIKVVKLASHSFQDLQEYARYLTRIDLGPIIRSGALPSCIQLGVMILRLLALSGASP